MTDIKKVKKIDNKDHKKNALSGLLHGFFEFDKPTNRKEKAGYFIVYTALLLVLGAIFFYPFLREGRSLVWGVDALDQHLPTLKYYSQWLRDIITHFFETGTFDPVQYDFSIGLGSDVFGALSYYTIGDPFYLFSCLVPSEYIELFYIAMIFLRIYCVGLAFSAMCFYFKKGRIQALLGSFVYCFSGTMISWGIRHPFFILPMIYLPLLIIGIEKVFRKEKPYFFVFMCFIMAISNFYCFYMLTIDIFIYALVQFFVFYKNKKSKVKSFFLHFFSFLKYYLLGIALAAVILLPVILNFLSNGRVGAGGNYSSLFFLNNAIVYFRTFFASFYNGASAAGTTALVFPALILLFMQKERKYSSFKILYVITVIFLLVPFFGYLFNGMNYVQNRWVYAACCLLAFILVEMLPKLAKIKSKQVIIILVSTLAIQFFLFICKDFSSKWMLNTCWLIMICVGVLALFNLIRKRETFTAKTYTKVFSVSITLVVCISLICGSNFKLIDSKYIEEFSKRIVLPSSLDNFQDSPAHMLGHIEDDTAFYRTDVFEKDYGYTFYLNHPMVNGYYGASAYLSTLDSNYFNMSQSLGVFGNTMTPSRFTGFNERSTLIALSSVKYMAFEDGCEANVPFGFKKIDSAPRKDALSEKQSIFAKKEGTYDMVDSLYENKYALPLGYTYSSYITSEEAESMTPYDRQQVMLESVILDEAPEGFKAGSYTSEIKELDYTITCPEGVKQTGDLTFEVRNTKESKITLEFQGLPNSETYVCYKGMWLSLPNPGKDPELFVSENASEKEKDKFKEKNRLKSDQTGSKVLTSGNDISHYFLYRTDEDRFNFGMDDYIANLGYSEEGIDSCTIQITAITEFALEDLKVVCIPMDNFEEKIDKLMEDVLTDVKIDRNEISGKISLDEYKILQLSIPYNKGWKAYVNGEEAELQKSDLMYMALPLSSGEHEIVLVYATRGISVGTVISLIALIGSLTVLIIRRKKARKKQESLKTA